MFCFVSLLAFETASAMQRPRTPSPGPPDLVPIQDPAESSMAPRAYRVEPSPAAQGISRLVMPAQPFTYLGIQLDPGAQPHASQLPLVIEPLPLPEGIPLP